MQLLALKVLSQPASASSSEQNWSQYDYVHNKRRNRLKSARASKLVFAYTSLRLIEKHTDYRRHLDVESDHVKSKSVIQVADQNDGNASETDFNDCDPSESESDCTDNTD